MNRVIIVISSVVLALQAASAFAAPVQADIVFILDNTYSMNFDNKLEMVKTRLTQFNQAMIDNNIDAQYALVKFGYVERELTNLGPFSALAAPLSTMHGHSDNGEDGSDAVNLAMSGVTFRQGAVKNIILITDEDDDSAQSSFAAADAALGQANAFFNFIGVPGVGDTDARYGVLASNHRGMAFDIRNFVAAPDNFFADFIDVKLSEISTPEPATLTLLGIGSMLALRRRRRLA